MPHTLKLALAPLLALALTACGGDPYTPTPDAPPPVAPPAAPPTPPTPPVPTEASGLCRSGSCRTWRGSWPPARTRTAR